MNKTAIRDVLKVQSLTFDPFMVCIARTALFPQREPSASSLTSRNILINLLAESSE